MAGLGNRVANALHSVLSPAGQGLAHAGPVQAVASPDATTVNLSATVALKAGGALTWGSAPTGEFYTSFGGTLGQGVIGGASVTSDGTNTQVSVSVEVGVEFKGGSYIHRFLQSVSVGVNPDDEK